eukprot:1294464-Prymnesium_polylepis.1
MRIRTLVLLLLAREGASLPLRYTTPKPSVLQVRQIDPHDRQQIPGPGVVVMCVRRKKARA